MEGVKRSPGRPDFAALRPCPLAALRSGL